jgi:hypothetical protein
MKLKELQEFLHPYILSGQQSSSEAFYFHVIFSVSPGRKEFYPNKRKGYLK